jgi:multiple antibiotic resistance protein
METLLLVLAAVFPVVNPPGSALVFLSMTRQGSVEVRHALARRVAINSFFVMTGSLLLGTFVLNLYGISVPVLRVAGGFVVAVSGWRLLNEGSQKNQEQSELSRETDRETEYTNMAFYPLTLPLTTGPGTIAVMISLGLTLPSRGSIAQEFQFVIVIIVATLLTAITVYICFKYADRLERLIGYGGINIAVRLSAFILFCLGVQILWTGASELLSTLPQSITRPPTIPLNP